jgi:hypothetical protein
MGTFFNFEGLTALQPVLLQAGRIININIVTHTYDVITDNDYQMKDLPLMHPYVSHEKGQGINYMPEVGTRCLVCNTVNGEDFILGFIVPIGTASPETVTGVDQRNRNSYQGRSGNRADDLIPGDVEFSTAGGNKIRLGVGGEIQIISAAGQCLSQYVPEPGKNLIFTKSDILEYVLSSGRAIWKTDNTDRTGGIELELKSNIDNELADVTIRMGVNAKDSGLEIQIGGDTNPTAKFAFAQDGTVTLECNSLTLKSNKNANIQCKNANISAAANVNITSGGTINLN